MADILINDVTGIETDLGTVFTFTVLLSSPAGPGGVSFDIATADGTATLANGDYVARSLTGQIIPAGSSSYTFDVTINGDTTPEPNETLFVNLTNVVGATVVDAQGVGTIVNDDIVPDISINDVTGIETDLGTVFVFTVLLSSPAGPGGVTFNIATADGTATVADGDYVPLILAGQIPGAGSIYVFAVTVNGDTTPEPNETFFVNLTNVVGSTVVDAQVSARSSTTMSDHHRPSRSTRVRGRATLRTRARSRSMWCSARR
jgi:hypothetical protein